MAGKRVKSVFILSIFFICMGKCSASDRRYINQLNNFKLEIRKDLTFINNDISTLFESIKDVKAAIGTKSMTNPKDDRADKRVKDIISSNCTPATGKGVAEPCASANAAIINAFESEKRLNRELQVRLQTMEATLSGIFNDMETYKSFMDNIHTTVKDIVSSLSIADGDVADKDRTTVSPIEIGEDDIVDYKEDIESTTTVTKPRQSCVDVPSSGVYEIYPETIGSNISVYCDADTDGGGWIVTMRRKDGTEDFDRNWYDYKNGFGNAEGEFWIGNNILYEMTKSNPMELRVDMEDFDGNKVFSKYKRFQIGSEITKYVLRVSGHSGMAGDSLIKPSNRDYKHNGMKFSTPDSDNDASGTNCAELYSAGWWFNKCFDSILTGVYSHSSSITKWKGIIWNSWTGMEKALKFVEMKVR